MKPRWEICYTASDGKVYPIEPLFGGVQVRVTFRTMRDATEWYRAYGEDSSLELGRNQSAKHQHFVRRVR